MQFISELLIQNIGETELIVTEHFCTFISFCTNTSPKVLATKSLLNISIIFARKKHSTLHIIPFVTTCPNSRALHTQ